MLGGVEVDVAMETAVESERVEGASSSEVVRESSLVVILPCVEEEESGSADLISLPEGVWIPLTEVGALFPRP